MTSTQDVREWLIKMQYPEVYPSEKALERLCKIGDIFQQIIDTVKPKAEIIHVKKCILANRLINDNTNIINDDEIPEIIRYNEKGKLEKEIIEINGRNIEKESSLQHLISKIKSKNIKLQQLKQTIHEREKDNVLFKAKSLAFNKQIENCTALLQQLDILQYSTNEEDLSGKFVLTLEEIEQVITKFDRELSLPAKDLHPICEKSSYLQTSIILSSNKKPLSTTKRLKRADSTRKNIFDVSNLSMFSSSIQKKNLSKISLSFNSSSASSNSDTFNINKISESLKELEHKSWSNSAIHKHSAEMWHFGPNYVLKSLIDMKIRHKKKIIDLIAENTSNSNDFSVCGLEKLYAHHIQTELKRMKCNQQQQKITEMLEANLDDSMQNIIILQVTEHGLQNSYAHLRHGIAKMQQDFVDNSDKVRDVLSDIKNVQDEVASTKSKLETNLCILYACNTWLNKIQKQVLENIKEPHSYSESQLLLTNTVEKDVHNFLSCPFQQNGIHPFDRWNQIYSDPQVRKMFQCPFLSPENSLQQHLNNKQWLNQLQIIEKTDGLNSKQIKITNVTAEALDNSIKKSMEKLKEAEDKCRVILTQLHEFDQELKLNLTAPLNDCVSPKIVHEGKTLKDYVVEFDEYYNKL